MYRPTVINIMYDKISPKVIFVVFTFILIITITNYLANLIVT